MPYKDIRHSCDLSPLAYLATLPEVHATHAPAHTPNSPAADTRMQSPPHAALASSLYTSRLLSTLPLPPHSTALAVCDFVMGLSSERDTCAYA